MSLVMENLCLSQRERDRGTVGALDTERPLVKPQGGCGGFRAECCHSLGHLGRLHENWGLEHHQSSVLMGDYKTKISHSLSL